MTGPSGSAPSLSAAQRAVATFGLPTADADRATDDAATIELGDDELRELITWAERQRLDGLLWSALAAGRLQPSAADADTDTDADADTDESIRARRQQASTAHLAGLRSSLAAEAAAVGAVAALRRAGVDAVLFKGLANAHLDYDRPEQRTFFDADLLVARHEFGTAIETLLAAGFHRSTPPIRERWEHRFARAAELRSPDGVEIDLHASLTTGYFGERLDHDALRADTDSVRLADRDHRTFGPAGRLLISSYAIVLSRGPGVRLLRDLAQQLLVTGADWQYAARLAGDGDIVLARGLLETARQLGIRHDAIDWAGTVTPTTTAARALAYADDAHHQGWSADARSTMLALGPTERIRFLAGVVLPSRASLRSRGRTVTGHLGRLWGRSGAGGDNDLAGDLNVDDTTDVASDQTPAHER